MNWAGVLTSLARRDLNSKSKPTSRVDMALARIEVEEVVVVDADDRGVVDFKFSPGRLSGT